METSRETDYSELLSVEAIKHDHAAWVTIRGEADIANHEQLRDELESIDLNSARVVHLSLSDLGFCDLAALRDLEVFVQCVRASGRDVRTHGANSTFLKVVQVLGLERDLGLA